MDGDLQFERAPEKRGSSQGIGLSYNYTDDVLQKSNIMKSKIEKALKIDLSKKFDIQAFDRRRSTRDRSLRESESKASLD